MPKRRSPKDNHHTKPGNMPGGTDRRLQSRRDGKPLEQVGEDWRERTDDQIAHRMKHACTTEKRSIRTRNMVGVGVSVVLGRMRGKPREKQQRQQIDRHQRGDRPSSETSVLKWTSRRQSNRGRRHPRCVPPTDGVAHIAAMASRGKVVLHDRPLQRAECAHGHCGDPQQRDILNQHQRRQHRLNQQHQTKCASWRHAVLKESQRATCIDRHHGVENAVDESQHQIVALGESVLTGGDEVEGVPEHAGSERTQESQARNGDGAGGLVAIGGHGLAGHGRECTAEPVLHFRLGPCSSIG